MLENKVFGMISLGCDKNRVDAERLLAIVRGRGFAVTDDISEANILIVNTCAFLDSARREAIETVLDCNSYRGGKLEKIVVTGCLPEKYIGELFPSLTEGDVFLGCNDADKLIEAIELSYEQGRVDMVHKGHESEGGRTLTTPLHYAYLKIADGCNNHCTYCLIPKIRGKYRSYPMESWLPRRNRWEICPNSFSSRRIPRGTAKICTAKINSSNSSAAFPRWKTSGASAFCTAIPMSSGRN